MKLHMKIQKEFYNLATQIGWARKREILVHTKTRDISSIYIDGFSDRSLAPVTVDSKSSRLCRLLYPISLLMKTQGINDCIYMEACDFAAVVGGCVDILTQLFCVVHVGIYPYWETSNC